MNRQRLALSCPLRSQARKNDCRPEYQTEKASSGVNAIEYAARLIARIKEGTTPNIVPRDCEFRFDLRYLPGTNADEAPERVRRYAGEALLMPPVTPKRSCSDMAYATRFADITGGQNTSHRLTADAATG